LLALKKLFCVLSKYFYKPGVVAHFCNFSSLGVEGRSIASSRLAWAKVVVRPYLKNKLQNQKGWGIAQVIGHFPCSIPSTTKRSTMNNYCATCDVVGVLCDGSATVFREKLPPNGQLAWTKQSLQL
jgi:hypothetical protein